MVIDKRKQLKDSSKLSYNFAYVEVNRVILFELGRNPTQPCWILGTIMHKISTFARNSIRNER